MKKKSFLTVLLAVLVALGSITNAFARPIESKDRQFVINTENGPRYCHWLNPNWGIDNQYEWGAGFQWVDLDRDGVFEFRYFLIGDEQDSDKIGYLYQPGMELSDVDREVLETPLLDEIVKDGQLYQDDETPFAVYKYGRPIQGGSGRQYRFTTYNTVVFNDLEGRLGNMRLESAGGFDATYMDESVFEREDELGDYYYHGLAYSYLPVFEIEHNLRFWTDDKAKQEELMDEYETHFQNWAAYGGEYTKLKDSRGITWYVAYANDFSDEEPVSVVALGYDYDNPYVNKTGGYKVRKYSLSFANAKSLGIDPDYVIRCLNYTE